MRNAPFRASCAALVALLLLSGMVADAAYRPSWVGVPKPDDDIYLYVDGMSRGQPTEADARAAAIEDARMNLERRLLQASPGPGIRLPAECLAELKALDEGYHVEGSGSRFAAWSRARFPREQARRIQGQIAVGQKISTLWQELLAQESKRNFGAALGLASHALDLYGDPLLAACSRSDLERKAKELAALQAQEERRGRLAQLWNEAETLQAQTRFQEASARLRELFGLLEQGDELPVAVEVARLRQASLLVRQRDYFEAYRCYSELVRTGTGEYALQARSALSKLPAGGAYRFWPMHDRWKGRGVAFVAAWDEGEGPRPFPELASQMAAYLTEARLNPSELNDTGAIAALPDSLAPGQLEDLVQAARLKGAGILWVIVLRTDPGKRGKTTQIPLMDGGSFEQRILDTARQLTVIDLTTGTALYSKRESFLSVGDDVTRQKAAEMTIGFSASRDLVQECPALP